ncbi:Type II secretion system protein G precursor [Novipirellula aureliae]|uniref:Type II secretion system protein G n=1 Tax=Novipirellula aureliae TaxID=2527966 RepID=A0A5C6EAV9_9BACT|nr:DUF1559 domain-containing protein [Novipirellula aureliae]TWU44871.1 Type II secretion system protein G precursor [Novipirellula aureliae]
MNVMTENSFPSTRLGNSPKLRSVEVVKLLTPLELKAARPLRPENRGKAGFTLVELLVVIAIIGVLVGLMLPAMQNLREMSRRSNCQQNLTQLSLALSTYAMEHTHYPVGTIADSGPVRSEAVGDHHNWIIGLLPMLDAQTVYDAVDKNKSVYAPENAEVRNLRLPFLQCPSATKMRENTSCYAGIVSSTETPIDTNNDGVMFLNVPVRDEDISDGLAYTAFVAEKLSRFEDDLGWMSGTRSSLRNTGHPINAELANVRGKSSFTTTLDPLYVGGIASDHGSGAHVLMGSGEYKFCSESIDLEILKQMGNRADGGIPIEWKSSEPNSETLTPNVAPAPKADPTPAEAAE